MTIEEQAILHELENRVRFFSNELAKTPNDPDAKANYNKASNMLRAYNTQLYKERTQS